MEFISIILLALTLTWTDNSSNESGFLIESLKGGVWTQIGKVGPNVATFTNTDSEGVYRVRAYITLPVIPGQPVQPDVFSLYSNTAARLNSPVIISITDTQEPAASAARGLKAKK